MLPCFVCLISWYVLQPRCRLLFSTSALAVTTEHDWKIKTIISLIKCNGFDAWQYVSHNCQYLHSIYITYVCIFIPYSTKLWRSWNCKNIGGENFGGSRRQAYSIFEFTRPDKFLADKTLADWQWTAKSAKVFSRQSFVLYGMITNILEYFVINSMVCFNYNTSNVGRKIMIVPAQPSTPVSYLHWEQF